MCTARLHHVPLCKIGLPSMRLPDEDFMDRLAETLHGSSRKRAKRSGSGSRRGSFGV